MNLFPFTFQKIECVNYGFSFCLVNPKAFCNQTRITMEISSLVTRSPPPSRSRRIWKPALEECSCIQIDLPIYLCRRSLFFAELPWRCFASTSKGEARDGSEDLGSIWLFGIPMRQILDFSVATIWVQSCGSDHIFNIGGKIWSRQVYYPTQFQQGNSPGSTSPISCSTSLPTTIAMSSPSFVQSHWFFKLCAKTIPALDRDQSKKIFLSQAPVLTSLTGSITGKFFKLGGISFPAFDKLIGKFTLGSDQISGWSWTISVFSESSCVVIFPSFSGPYKSPASPSGTKFTSEWNSPRTEIRQHARWIFQQLQESHAVDLQGIPTTSTLVLKNPDGDSFQVLECKK